MEKLIFVIPKELLLKLPPNNYKVKITMGRIMVKSDGILHHWCLFFPIFSALWRRMSIYTHLHLFPACFSYVESEERNIFRPLFSLFFSMPKYFHFTWKSKCLQVSGSLSFLLHKLSFSFPLFQGLNQKYLFFSFLPLKLYSI